MRIRLEDVTKIMARGDLEDKNPFLNLLEMQWMHCWTWDFLQHLTDSLPQNPLVTSGYWWTLVGCESRVFFKATRRMGPPLCCSASRWFRCWAPDEKQLHTQWLPQLLSQLYQKHLLFSLYQLSVSNLRSRSSCQSRWGIREEHWIQPVCWGKPSIASFPKCWPDIHRES